MANYFNFLDWSITLENIESKELVANIEAQSIFLHEYIHYCQHLSSTFGRIVIKNIIITLIKAALFKLYGNNIPERIQPFDLWNVLKNCTAQDFQGTTIKNEYFEVFNEYQIIMSCEMSPYNMNKNEIFVDKEINVNGVRRIYPHIVVEYNSNSFLIPLSERILYENMARQVQRNYLQFNNQLNSNQVDRLKNTQSEQIYLCIHQLLEKILPYSEPVSHWTITFCQLALLCRHPGEAFKHIYERLKALPNLDLNSFIDTINNDAYFLTEYNIPNIQTLINDLIQKYGAYISVKERSELRNFVLKLGEIYNKLNTNKQYFSRDLINWHEVKEWVNLFGCPPISCKDVILTNFLGNDTNEFWHKYFKKIHEMLYV